MKLAASLNTVLFWNIWGHRHPEGIHDYIRNRNPDICCLTEVTQMSQAYHPIPRIHTSKDPNEPASYINGLEQLVQYFGETYEIHYNSPSQQTRACAITGAKYLKVGFGSVTMIKKGTFIDHYEEIIILKGFNKVQERVLQVSVIIKNGYKYLIAHLHGVWLKDNTKGDDPIRDLQSMQVRNHLERIAKERRVNRIIFGGDLNLDIDTWGLQMIERGDGMSFKLINQIRLRHVNSTRTEAYRKYGKPGESMFADYVFTTEEVTDFGLEVGNENTASDHAPLLLTYQ